MNTITLNGITLNGNPIHLPVKWVLVDRFGSRVGYPWETKDEAEKAATLYNEGEGLLDWLHVEAA